MLNLLFRAWQKWQLVSCLTSSCADVNKPLLFDALLYLIYSIFLLYRWSISSYIIFPIAGLVVTLLLVIVLIEKFTCVPKRLSRLIVHLTSNKMLHQMMAITNILTLLSCVLLPMVSIFRPRACSE